MKLHTALRRTAALMLALLLTLPVLCTARVSAHSEAPSDGVLMRQFETFQDLTDEERMAAGFWEQKGLSRSWIKKIVFHNSTQGAVRNIYDFSDAFDGSMPGWYENGTLHIACDSKIYLNPDCSWLFANFVNLEEIDFGGIVDASLVKDMNHMFYECQSLKKLDLSGFVTPEVTNMCCMFYNCCSLESLDISNFDTAKVTDMCQMFAYCGKLTELNVSSFRTPELVDASFLFYCCKELKALDLSGFDTANVLYMNSMFYHCEALEKLDVSSFDTSHVIGMACMFAGCKALKDVDVSGFDTSSVKGHWNFMDSGVTVGGQPWEALFR